MLNEQYMDGVAAITQCKAAPHQTQVYEFKVTNKGHTIGMDVSVMTVMLNDPLSAII